MAKDIGNYSKTIKVSTTPSIAFLALTENLHSWWGHISKSIFKKNGQFRVQFDNGYWWDFRISEYIPNSEITWICTDGEPDFNKEWIGHTLYWKVDNINNGTSTKITFLHDGLIPEIACYDICAPTWDRFITQELKSYLNNIYT